MASNLPIRIGEFFLERFMRILQRMILSKSHLTLKDHRIIKIRKFPHLSFVDSEPDDSEPDDRIKQIENSDLSRYQKIKNKTLSQN